MDPITIMALASAASTGMGYLQGQEAKKKERRDALMNAEIARWSPWTKMMPGQIERSNATGNMMQGGITGLAMGQNINQMNAYDKYLQRTAPQGTTAPQVAPPAAMAELPAAGYYPQQDPNAYASQTSPWMLAGR